MPSTFSPNLHLELQATGEDNGTWGSNLNANVFTNIDNAMGRVLSLPLAGADVTLTTDQTLNNMIDLTGVLAANVKIIFPQIGRNYFVRNGTTGAFTVTLQTTAVGGATYVIPQKTASIVTLNGTDVIPVTPASVLKWQSRGIGEIYYVDTSIVGVDIPPSSTTDTVWIQLTSGLTGVGGFNNGKLTSESVAGSPPLVVATAVVNFAASPINGKTVHLLNTESRITRPSATAGALQDDALQGHRHSISTSIFTANSGSIGTGSGSTNPISIGDPITDGTNGTPRTANETRMKNIGVTAYMRIA